MIGAGKNWDAHQHGSFLATTFLCLTVISPTHGGPTFKPHPLVDWPIFPTCVQVPEDGFGFNGGADRVCKL